MILIKNGRVVDPVTNTDRKLDVLVDGAVIAETAERSCFFPISYFRGID